MRGAIVVRFSDINQHEEAKAEVLSLLHGVAGVEHLYFQPPPELSNLFVIHLDCMKSIEIEQAASLLEMSPRVRHAERSA